MKTSFIAAEILLICLSTRAMAADTTGGAVTETENFDMSISIDRMPAPTLAIELGPSTIADFLVWADALLLAGEALPVDLMLRMALLTPADRVLAAAYLRRSGLLSGAALPLDTLLAPQAAGRP